MCHCPWARGATESWWQMSALACSVSPPPTLPKHLMDGASPVPRPTPAQEQELGSQEHWQVGKCLEEG